MTKQPECPTHSSRVAHTMGIGGFALVSLAVLAAVSGTTGAAAVRVRRAVNGHPAYDDAFMRKLCAFLGATYVRSAKDPLCWYTWCHAGEPYHMQCPPGRATSKHFYWSSDDPCTETDAKEHCVIGFLKSMHLPKEEERQQEVYEDMARQGARAEATAREAAVRTGHYVEAKQAPRAIAEDFAKPDMMMMAVSDLSTDEEKPEMSEPLEPVPEPEPEEEPEKMVATAEPRVILKQIPQPAGKVSNYYPGHGRAHIVDSFVLQQDPKRRFGVLPRRTSPYIPVFYSPRPYFPRYRYRIPPHAPARPRPRPSAGPRAQALMAEQKEEEEGHVNDIIYRRPEGRQAPLGGGKTPEEEPQYDAEYISDEYLDPPAQNQPQQQQEQEGAQHRQSEAAHVNTLQVAPPLMDAVTMLPSSFKEENHKEEGASDSVIVNGNGIEDRNALEDGNAIEDATANKNVSEEDAIEAATFEDYEEAESRSQLVSKEPIVYDYFKTHFVDRI